MDDLPFNSWTALRDARREGCASAGIKVSRKLLSLKILHLPDNVAGAASGLSQGEKSLGHDSRVLAMHRSRFGFVADEQLDIEDKGRAGRIATYLKTFARVRSGYDLYNFGFGSSLWHFPDRGLYLMDLPFYDRRAKKVMTYQGCDARQKYPTMKRREREAENPIAACFEENCYGGMCNSGRKDLERRKSIDKAAKYSDHLFAVNPDLVRFLPAEKSSFLPYAISDFHDLPEHDGRFFDGDVAHIVHAPTQREAKGSRFILAALEALRDEFGAKLRVTLVEDMARKEALSIIATADLLIDQAVVGWYGGAAVEAMKMGVPVACYINENDLDFVPPEMAAELPFLRITPFDIKDPVREFLSNRDLAPDLAPKGLDYVMRWHDPADVAKRVFRTVFGTETPEP